MNPLWALGLVVLLVAIARVAKYESRRKSPRERALDHVNAEIDERRKWEQPH